ncbi:MAG TPA: malonate decarboxylase holo-[acyl-carrier-protein] synthase [Dongiaceae bacterium]|nr:malonate decarboxylase holo-[acyl-carrier-protein] synthase [Dongiaceae bacterium]
MPETHQPEPLQRHTFVKVEVAAWAALIATRPDLADEPLVTGWAQRRFPLIVRRGVGGADDKLVALGLPLPPSHGKRRIAVALPRDTISEIAAPPLLSEAAQMAPEHWQDVIRRLVALSQEVRCFGSLAWQYLTGLPYLSAGSDLDLLWSLPDADDLDGLLAAVAHLERDAPMRIDGEIIGTQGGVNWRELHQVASSEVLLKGLHEICMIERAAFLAGAPA